MMPFPANVGEDQHVVLRARLDIAWLLSFLDMTPQSKAVCALRDALRTKKRRS